MLLIKRFFMPCLPASSGSVCQRAFLHHGGLMLWALMLAWVLAGCAGRPPLPSTGPVAGTPIVREKSRWVPVPWASVPGVTSDAVGEAWPAWLQSCQKPGPVFAAVCPEVRRLANASDADKRQWLLQRFQPYRIESHAGQTEGLLTSYYEPVLRARRQPFRCTGRLLVARRAVRGTPASKSIPILRRVRRCRDVRFCTWPILSMP